MTQVAIKMSAGELVQKIRAGERDFTGLQLPPDSDLSKAEGYDALLDYLKGEDLRAAPVLAEGADLRGLKAPRLALSFAKLAGANLKGCNLAGADMRRADFSNADFSQLVFDERGLDFTNATLVGTKMNLSDSGAATTSAGLNFTNADLTEAELTLSVTQAPIFTGARMKHCKLLLPEGLDVQHRLSSEQRSQTTITRSSTREESKQPTKSGCFIAAAVYGHADCPQVLVLRRFRDEVLARTFLGRAGICVYYHLGPMAAQWLNQKPGLMRAIRRVLDWCVKSIQSKRDFLRT